MNSEDKAAYHESIVKNMTRKCHNKCFKINNLNNYHLDENCLSSCYHKYINLISKLRSLTFELGKKNESQFIYSAYSLGEVPLMNFIWTQGGSNMMPIPPMALVAKHMQGVVVHPYKGFSPFRDPLENQ